MKTYYIAIVFASGRDLKLVSTLSEEERETVDYEFTTGVEMGFIETFNCEEIKFPNSELETLDFNE